MCTCIKVYYAITVYEGGILNLQASDIHKSSGPDIGRSKKTNGLYILGNIFA